MIGHPYSADHFPACFVRRQTQPVPAPQPKFSWKSPIEGKLIQRVGAERHKLLGFSNPGEGLALYPEMLSQSKRETISVVGYFENNGVGTVSMRYSYSYSGSPGASSSSHCFACASL